MADNSALLADLSELQRTNKELTDRLAAAARQLEVAAQEAQQAQDGVAELQEPPATAPPSGPPAHTQLGGGGRFAANPQ